MFKNRTVAGKLLGIAVAEALTGIPDERPVRTIVVALSRGGTIVGKEVAAIMCASLTIRVSKLINSPNELDKPLAAVSSSGIIVHSDDFDESKEGLPSYVRAQQIQLAKLSKTLEQHWLDEAQCIMPSFNGKRVVLVNEGSTNGLTELAILRSIRPEKPRQLIVALPVVSHAAARMIQHECNMIVSLISPDSVASINRHYEQFDHVSDSEIVSAVKAANNHDPSKEKHPDL